MYDIYSLYAPEVLTVGAQGFRSPRGEENVSRVSDLLCVCSLLGWYALSIEHHCKVCFPKLLHSNQYCYNIFMNWSLLSLLKIHVERDNQWTEYLQLCLLIYGTTNYSPRFMCCLATTDLHSYPVHLAVQYFLNLPTSYCEELKNKFVPLRKSGRYVRTDLVESGYQQQYGNKGSVCALPVMRHGQQILLNKPLW